MQQAYKLTDLAPEERVAVERLVGRPLQNDEAVEFEIECRQSDVDRRNAVLRIRELAKGKKLGDVTVRELIDEGRRL